jgi:hypothetical protein
VILFIYFRSLSLDQVEKRKEIFNLTKESSLKLAKKEPSNPKILYLILIMNIEIKQKKNETLRIPQFKKLEDIAI